jgi:hypothetical protein
VVPPPSKSAYSDFSLKALTIEHTPWRWLRVGDVRRLNCPPSSPGVPVIQTFVRRDAAIIDPTCLGLGRPCDHRLLAPRCDRRVTLGEPPSRRFDPGVRRSATQIVSAAPQVHVVVELRVGTYACIDPHSSDSNADGSHARPRPLFAQL